MLKGVHMKKVICLSLIFTLFFPLNGCSTQSQVTDLMSDYQANSIESKKTMTDRGTRAITDFTLQLFQHEISTKENTLLSPISILYALAMSANGAKENTLTEMEKVFGLPIHDLNADLNAFRHSLPESSKYKLDLANSIWLKDDEKFNVKEAFLQINADAYDAGLYQAPFNNNTLNAINKWVSDHTDGMIEEILDEISQDATMFLINAIAFEAEWEKPYTIDQVNDGKFTSVDGTLEDVELMSSTEYNYLSDDQATGFIKYYADQKYAFVALLPDENIKLQDYAASLSSEQLSALLSQAQDIKVNTAIPKFEIESYSELSDTLIAMGMIDAFDSSRADFTGIAESNLAIDKVQHKTYLAVNEQGSKAGAAAVVEMEATAALKEPEEVKEVILNRPFLFMLIECDTNIPIFIGTVMNIK